MCQAGNPFKVLSAEVPPISAGRDVRRMFTGVEWRTYSKSPPGIHPDTQGFENIHVGSRRPTGDNGDVHRTCQVERVQSRNLVGAVLRGFVDLLECEAKTHIQLIPQKQEWSCVSGRSCRETVARRSAFDAPQVSAPESVIFDVDKRFRRWAEREAYGRFRNAVAQELGNLSNRQAQRSNRRFDVYTVIGTHAAFPKETDLQVLEEDGEDTSGRRGKGNSRRELAGEIGEAPCLGVCRR